MRIEELTPTQEITLVAKIGEETLEFISVVQDTLPSKHMILTDVVRQNGKIITFRAKNLIVDLLVSPPDNSPMIFKNVTIDLRKKQDDTLCYAITTIADAKVLNRRQHFRCPLGFRTAVQCGSNNKAVPATLHDVSSSGFSVAVDPEQEFHENQVLHTILNDYLEELAEKFSFHLYGIVVRKQEMESGMILYGCRLNQKVSGLDAYIMKKERLRLRKNSGL